MEQNEPRVKPLLIDSHAAGALLGVSFRTVERLADAGKLPSLKIGSRRLWTVEGVERFIAEQLREAADARR